GHLAQALPRRGPRRDVRRRGHRGPPGPRHRGHERPRRPRGRLGGARARRRGHARRAGCRRGLGWLRMADMTRDEIVLTGLTVFGRHGVFAHERADGQEFTIDLHLRLSLADAAASDDVADTVHYGELAEAVAAVVAGEPVNLIETLA